MLVHHSTTRRKACAQCIRVKRRCDLGLPYCGRCSKRKLSCRYGEDGTKIARATTSEAVSEEPQLSQAATSQAVAEDSLPIPSRPPTSVTTTAGSVKSFFPQDTFTFPELAPITAEQVEFTVQQFQACIMQLVQGNKLPFMHHAAHRDAARMPSEYQDLLGVTAMYSQKTSRNQHLVYAMLDRSLSRLVSASSSWDFEDLLFGTQALVFYQIIRLFDGDVRQRANAERQLPILDTWTNRLQDASNLHQEAQLFNSTASAFDRWVLAESARRTVLVSVMLQAIYSLLRDGICTSVPFMASLPVSLDGKIWTKDEHEWWTETAGKDTELVTYSEYVSKWTHGDALQIDAYETMLLVACKHNAQRFSECKSCGFFQI